MTTAATRRPQAGDAFYLDGFWYRLAGTKRKLDEASEAIRVFRHFERPPAETPEREASHRTSLHYKKAGMCEEVELVWLDAPDFREGVRAQAFALAGGRPAAKAWALANIAVLEAEDWPGGWTLPGRLLVKPGPDGYPADLDAAKAALDAILTCTVEG